MRFLPLLAFLPIAIHFLVYILGLLQQVQLLEIHVSVTLRVPEILLRAFEFLIRVLQLGSQHSRSAL